MENFHKMEFGLACLEDPFKKKKMDGSKLNAKV